MKRLLLFTLLCITTSILNAQNSPVKDEQLKRLIKLAVNNFPRIKELQEQTKLYAIRNDLAKSSYQPTITGNATYAYIAPLPYIEFGNNKLFFAPNNNYNAAITLNQLIYDFGKIKLQLDRNKAESSLVDLNIDNSKNAVAYQVSQIYYAIQFFHKAIATQQEQIDALKSNEKLIQAKLDNGDALRYDLLTTQVRTANAANRLEDLQNQLDKQYILLQWLTGSDEKSKFNFNISYDLLPLIIDSVGAMKDNGEAQVLQKKIDLLQYDVKAASYNERPTIHASATGGVKNGYQPDIEPMRLNGSVAVGLNVPIFNGSRPKLQQKLTQVQIDAIKASLNTLQTAIQKDLLLNAEDFKLLTEKLKNTNILLTQAQKAYDIANVRFKNGLITNTELLLVQTSLEDAKLQQVQLQYQLQLDRLESHRIFGNKLY